MTTTEQSKATSAREPAVLEDVLRATRSVRFGSVHVVIQDSRVVRIVTTEKRRIDRPRE